MNQLDLTKNNSNGVEKEWSECNPCFDGEHTECVDISCECPCKPRNRVEMPVEKTVEELFEEYATLKYLESEENEYVTNEKYAQIISEVKSQVRREVLHEALEEINSWDYDTIMNSTPYQLFENYILSKGITLKN